MFNHTGNVDRLPAGVPLFDMTKAAWSFPSINKTSDKEHVPDSVPLPGNRVAVLDLTKERVETSMHRTEAFEPKNTPRITNKDENKTKHIGRLSGNTDNTFGSNKTISGVYIPVAKLSRLKRQTPDISTPDTNSNQGRVYILMHPNSKSNRTIAGIKSEVLMLLKHPNIAGVPLSNGSFSPQPITNVATEKNTHKLFHQQRISVQELQNSLREVIQRQTSVQRIKDLNTIKLPVTLSGNKTSSQTTLDQLNELQLRNILQVLTSLNSKLRNQSFSQHEPQGGVRHNVQQHSRQRNNPLTNNQHRVEHITSRQTHSPERMQSAAHTRRVTLQDSNELNIQPLTNRRLIITNSPQHLHRNQARRVLSQPIPRTQPQLAIQEPVSNRRITVRPAGSRQSSSNRRASVRLAEAQHRPSSIQKPSSSRTRIAPQRPTVSRRTRPLVQTISSQQLEQTSGRRIIQPRIRATHRGTRTQRRRLPTRRQNIRRRQTPPDPFTQRFSAGFQRGSNLLTSPPLELTNFARSGPVGFNTLSNTRLPPRLRTARPFGGLGLPGLFL